MKKKLAFSAFIILFSFFTPCIGQFNSYHPIPDTNAAWRETTWTAYMCGLGYDDIREEFDYYAAGDTIVTGKTYTKLYTSGGYEHNDGGCGPIDTIWQCFNSLKCLIRNDTLSKKVYASFPPNLGVDTLLYDFTLQVGDTLPDSYISRKSLGYYVSSIDSIWVGASYRKQFNIAIDTGTNRLVFDSIIEGTGSAQGLLEQPTPPAEGGGWIDCFVESGMSFTYSSFYPCNMFYTCPVTLASLVTVKPVDTVSVYPTPSSGKFTFQLSVATQPVVSIEIYNTLGEDVKSEELRAKSTEIDLSAQPNGVYLYRVLGESGSLVGQGKVVVEK